MNFAGILAGGMGTRMGKTDLPKQFLMLGEKPILIHTVEQFIIADKIDYIVIAVPENWINYTKDIIDKYCSDDRITVIQGGKSRNETIFNICNYIKENYEVTEKDVIVTHDAVRPFITQRIINDNIEKCKEFGATDTVIPATDTIVEAKDNMVISNIPIRDIMYQGQTPQSFNILKFMEVSGKLTEDEKDILTDAAKIYVLKNQKVGLVMGELYNMKITTTYDLKMANLMLNYIENKE